MTTRNRIFAILILFGLLVLPSGNLQVQAATFPILYYPFDEGLGETTADLIGGRTGTFDYTGDAEKDSLVWASDVTRGTHLFFDGSEGNGHIDVPDVPGLFSTIATNDTASFSFWLKMDDAHLNWSQNTFTAKDTAGNFSYYNHIPNKTADIYWFTQNGSDPRDILQSNNQLTFEETHRWGHYVFTKDRATGVMEFWFDGSLVKSVTGQDGDMIVPATFVLNSWRGWQDDFAIFDHVLSETEIGEIHAGTFPLTPIPEPGTVSLLVSGLLALVVPVWRRRRRVV